MVRQLAWGYFAGYKFANRQTFTNSKACLNDSYVPVTVNIFLKLLIKRYFTGWLTLRLHVVLNEVLCTDISIQRSRSITQHLLHQLQCRSVLIIFDKIPFNTALCPRIKQKLYKKFAFHINVSYVICVNGFMNFSFFCCYYKVHHRFYRKVFVGMD